MTDLSNHFLTPKNKQHKHYEALRAVFVEKIPIKVVANQFGFAYGTLRNLCSAFQKHPNREFFLPNAHRPAPANVDQPPRPDSRSQRDQRILQLRKEKNLSVEEIYRILLLEEIQVSISTVGRIVRKAGVPKLRRRPRGQQMDNILIHRAPIADYRNLDLTPRQFSTDFGGLFLFASDLARMDLDALLEASSMPGSDMIPAGCAVRALLALKLWGTRRLSHVMDDILDPGLALFAGLNAMPKQSTLTEYSNRVHPQSIRHLMNSWHSAVRSLGISLGNGVSFDLDFHTIPYHGEDALTEKHFISKRSRSQKGILSLVVRDADARCFVYADAQLRKKNRQDCLEEFLTFWKDQTGAYPKEVVFDSTFTTYAHLQKLTELGIHFLTLRRRSTKMVEELNQIPANQWKQIRLTNVGRTFKTPRILEKMIQVRGYKSELRQIAILDLGHEKPTLLITNQMKTSAAKLIDRYARRMIVENTIADAIDFFHMDALTSSVPLKVDMDLQLTLMASTLYRVLASRVGNGFETAKPRTIFRKLVQCKAKIEIQPNEIIVKLPRRSNNPYLLAAGYTQRKNPIQWLGQRKLRIQIQ